MKDKSFTVKDVKRSVIVGGSVQGNVTNIHQTNDLDSAIDLAQLANELSQLRDAMLREATTDDESIAVGEIAQAKKAAEAQNPSEVVKHLKLAGQWALDVAIKIGVPVVVEALKRAIL